MKPLDPAAYPTFYLGDQVTIRQWDDMAAEFGLNKNGGIAIPGTFTTNMKSLCGKTFTINDVRYCSNPDLNIYCLGGNGYYFTAPMFEQSKLISVPSPTLSFDDFLKGGT